MFFFSPRVYKYNNSARIERTTALGFWKITGKRTSDQGSRVHWEKEDLDLYEGRVRQSKKTNWVMYEYYLVEDEENPNPTRWPSSIKFCPLA
ncbi:protein NTM1-like 9 [Prunus yedoensis var. nudiflora]|uniref:Protein NTM1-like 9 n=1 Tax=Prunus yedoensis var. nudiflora TaxID=2094558 RepID=A0A314YGM5_PRUYE|nr:protein NTM1-like 9 [Prunus yedoensis var. nudiflora]